MKLKPDLIRDLLLYSHSLAEQTETSSSRILEDSFLASYSWGELFSAISLIGSHGADLMEGEILLSWGGSSISHIGPLTTKGQSYLKLIENQERWLEIKEHTGVAPGSVTVEALGKIAKTFRN